MKLALTPELIHAAGTDAGNESMRRHGRRHWNEDDLAACAQATNRLWDIYGPYDCTKPLDD